MNVETQVRSNEGRKVQFRLRTLFFTVLPVLCFGLAMLSLKLRQDANRRDAYLQIALLGFQSSISSRQPNITAASFTYTRQTVSDAEMEELAGHLSILTRRYDLGISAGDRIELVDLSGALCSDAAVARLLEKLPDSEIRR